MLETKIIMQWKILFERKRLQHYPATKKSLEFGNARNLVELFMTAKLGLQIFFIHPTRSDFYEKMRRNPKANFGSSLSQKAWIGVEIV